jgi:hypothetical protein
VFTYPDGQTDSIGVVEYAGVAEQSAGDYFADSAASATRESPALDEAIEWLADFMVEHNGRHPAADIKAAAKADGIAAATLTKARRKLNIESRRRGFGQGTEWVRTGGEAFDDDDASGDQ